MKKITCAILAIMISLVMLSGCGASAREGWSSELCEAADGIMKSQRKAPESNKHGIIVMRSGFFDDTRKVELYLVDPKTGKAELFAEFTWGMDQAIIGPVGFYGNLRDAFDKNYSRMAATAYIGGLSHAGWMTQDGIFSDATEALGLECTNDESGYTDYRAYGFSEGYFYYAEWVIDYVSSELTLYRVPADDLRAEVVDEVTTDDPYMYFWENIYNSTQTWSQTVQREMQPSMVIDSRYVLSDYGMNLMALGSVSGDSSFVITTPEQAISVFEDDEICWNPTLSPDNKKICYLRRFRNDDSISLCILSLKTGESEVVDTNDLLSSILDDAGESIVYTVLGWY